MEQIFLNIQFAGRKQCHLESVVERHATLNDVPLLQLSLLQQNLRGTYVFDRNLRKKTTCVSLVSQL